jgi:PAS domain S-box-containing protein
VVKRYGVAVCISLAVIALRGALQPMLGGSLPLELLTLAVLISAWWGGFGPGLLATVLCALAGEGFFLTASGGVLARPASELIHLGGFAITGVAISAIAGALHRAFLREQQQTEALRASEERLRLAVRATEDSVWDWDIATDVLGWSPAVAERFGWPDAPPGTDQSWWMDRIHPDDRTRVMESISAAIADPRCDHWEEEYRFRRGDGSSADVLDRGYVLRDAKGRAVRMIGAMLDLTARKEADAAVRRSREQLQAIIDTVPSLISYVDESYVYRWNNHAYERWFDRPLSEITGRPMVELLGQEAFDRIRPHLDRALAGTPSEYDDYLAYEGSKGRWIHAIYAPHHAADGRVDGVVVSVTDVSERKHAELSQAALAAIVENSDEAIIGKTLAGEVTSWNRAAERLFGYTAGEMIGQNIACIIPEGRREEEELIRARVRRGENVAHYESQRLTKSGRLIDVAITTSPIEDREGNVIGVSTIARDITERKRAEAAVLEAAEQRRLGLEAADLGAWEYRFTTGEVVGDERFFRMFGTMAEVLSYDEALARVHPEDRAAADQAAQAALAGANDGKFRMEMRVLWPDGSLRWVASYGRVYFSGAPGDRQPLRFIGVNMDITDRKRAMEELRLATERFQAALRTTSIVVFEQDLDLRYTWIHNSTLGLTTADILGKTDYDLMERPEDAEANVALRREVIATGLPKRVEITVQAGGRLRKYDLAVEPRRDANGRIIGVTCAAVDITAHKAAEDALRESREALSLALEGAKMGTWDWDIRTGALHWSERTFELFGLPPDSVPIYSDFLGNVHPEDQARVEAAVGQALEKEPHSYECEYRVVLPDGSHRWIFGKGTAHLDPVTGTPLRMVGVQMDVTDRVLASGRLAAALDAAETANRAKDAFLAALSHELRTPLTPVLFLAATLERSPDVAPALREDFAMIRRNIELEARLIDDLLDLTRITRGKLQLDREPTDLHAVLDRSIELLRGEIDARHRSLQVARTTGPHQASADPVRLQQVFWNILKNAVKFTPEGGTISVRSHCTAPGTWHVAITDSGLGITAEELPRIFDAFAQGEEASSHRFGGLGLGLAISSLLVREHGGRLWAESPGRDQGATFHLELPLDATAAAPPADPTTPAPAAAARRILVVEDHEPTRKTLERLLKRRGYEVTIAETVAQARKIASSATFDLMISDLGLPDGSGHDLAVEFNRDYAMKAIALSGYGMEDDVRRSKVAGFLAHITKPVDIEELHDAILLALDPTRTPPGA